jgi:hypothetical protein
MVMAADGYRQQSIKSGDGNGRCDGDSNDDGNGATVMATTINNKRQQKKWRRQSCNGGGGRNGGNGGRNCGGIGGSHYSAPVKGRGDRCSNHCCQVSTAATTISAASAWTPWLKYRRLEGLFQIKFYLT